MEAATFSEMLSYCNITWHYNPEALDLALQKLSRKFNWSIVASTLHEAHFHKSSSSYQKLVHDIKYRCYQDPQLSYEIETFFTLLNI